MRARVAVLAMAIVTEGAVASAQVPGACPPAGYTIETLQLLKAAKFAVADAPARRSLALALTGCLGHPDPHLRDGVAFEALSSWMRAGDLDRATLIDLRDVLIPMLKAPDPQGFQRPFAALVLSEVARTDRVKPWMSAGERQLMSTAAENYLPGIEDYRGFSDTEGWRHGVAHGADLILQLALNQDVAKPQLDRLLHAIATQVSPPRVLHYHAGEPDRLARPVLFIAQRKVHTEPEWSAWFAQVSAPAPLPNWQAAFSSELGLARRHNLRAFLLSLYASVRESEDPGVGLLLKPIQSALKQTQ